MSEPPSAYYPPRAGWKRHFYRAVYAAKRQLHIEDLNLPRLGIEISAPRFLFCVLIPGFSFYHAGWKRIGQATALAWLTAACLFILLLGYNTSNVAFGLMMSMHVSSVLHLLNRALPGKNVLGRLAMSLAVLFVIGQLIYATGLNWFQNHLFMPLRSGEKVYVVNRLRSIDTLRPGDLVALHSERIGLSGVYIREGYLLDRILAGPGDDVQFEAHSFRVNGAPAARLDLMPSSGSVLVPEKTWLVWPTLDTIARNNVGEDAIAKSVLRMALVPREKIIGKPFKRWFWRDQTQ